MVAIEEISAGNEGSGIPAEDAPLVEELSLSEERRLDAEAIEEAAGKMTRVSARVHLESLAKRLRKESEALARVEKSRKSQEVGADLENSGQQSAVANDPAIDSKTESGSTAETSAQNQGLPKEVTAPPPTPLATPPIPISSLKYVPIDKFAFDAGGYNAQFVTLYIELPGVGSIPKENITCNFTSDSFDLIISGLNNKSYRLCKDNLEKDIDPDKSKIVVKKDRILVKLSKVKQGEYGGYDYWSQLTAKKSKKDKEKSKTNPQASIMELMKDMYDQGDDNMRKVIGETMMKQQRGDLGNGMGGMGDGGDFGMGDL
ncbi:hypothetical protein ACA910_018495 [Epithemia clementina (nom. ined.)]